MSTLVSTQWRRKVLGSMPEIWYITILSVYTFSLTYHLINTGWHYISFIFTLFLTLCIGLLVKQLFRRNGWIGFLLGFIFAIGSFFMIAALLSEYSEFTQKTSPDALKLIIAGGVLIGTSLFLSIKMWLKGVHKIYIS